MATQADRDELEQKTGKALQPAKPFPRIPDRFKVKKEDAEAWSEYEAKVDEWVRTGRGG